VSRFWQAPRMRRVRIATGVVGLVLLASACSGGGGSSSSSASSPAVAPAAKQQAAIEAARACRMWTEIATAALKVAPLTQAQAAPYDTKSAAIATVANAASTADATWNALATDVAGANDFASVALPDIDTRITTDCNAVPASARAAVAAEPDPYSTTSTTQ